MCANVVAVYCSFAAAGDGKLDEMEVLFRRELKTCIAQLGNDHSETAQARQRWAFVLAQQSKYQEAEPHVRAALETFRVSCDVGCPAELLDCLHTLVDVLAGKNKYSDVATVRSEIDAVKSRQGGH